MNNTTKIAAIFDFDNTIISVDSFHNFIRYIYINNFMLYIPWLIYIVILRKLRVISLEKFKIMSLLPLKGKSKQEIYNIGKCYFNIAYNKIYIEAIDRIKWHINKSHVLILATSCPNIYIELFSNKLNFDHYISTDLKFNDNIFEGLFKGKDNYSKLKADRVQRLCLNNNICLSESFFYTDNKSDIPLCNLTKHVCFINPSKRYLTNIKSENYNLLYWENTLNE